MTKKISIFRFIELNELNCDACLEGLKIRDPTENDYLALQGSTLSAPVNSVLPGLIEIVIGDVTLERTFQAHDKVHRT